MNCHSNKIQIVRSVDKRMWGNLIAHIIIHIYYLDNYIIFGQSWTKLLLQNMLL